MGILSPRKGAHKTEGGLLGSGKGSLLQASEYRNNTCMGAHTIYTLHTPTSGYLEPGI